MSEKKTKQLLFSVTKKDLDIEFFISPGPGGQHKNKTLTACRMVHPASGATVTATEHKSQSQNREAAFKRLVATKEFKSWHKLETARKILNYQSIQEMIDTAVDAQMRPANLKFEVQDKKGRWVECGEELIDLGFDDIPDV